MKQAFVQGAVHHSNMWGQGNCLQLRDAVLHFFDSYGLIMPIVAGGPFYSTVAYNH